MNNLHRELAPISDAAWSEIEEETSRTIKRYLAGRRVVDVQGPLGMAYSAIGTGHLRNVAAPGDGILARQRAVKPLVELRVPFELDRQQIDDVERGANDSDWQPAKDAARLLASTYVPTPTSLPRRSVNCDLPASTVPIRCCWVPMPIPP